MLWFLFNRISMPARLKIKTKHIGETDSEAGNNVRGKSVGMAQGSVGARNSGTV